MKNYGQLLQQHCIENGAESSLVTTKPAYEITKTHIESIRKKNQTQQNIH